MKPSYEELQAERDALAAQVEILKSGLNELVDVAQRCDSWESFPQKPIDTAIDAINATPASCLAQVRAEAGVGLADSLVDDFHDFCSGLDSMMITLDADEIADAIIGLVNVHAERIRQEVK